MKENTSVPWDSAHSLRTEIVNGGVSASEAVHAHTSRLTSPVGVQIISTPFDEMNVLAFARQLEVGLASG